MATTQGMPGQTAVPADAAGDAGVAAAADLSPDRMTARSAEWRQDRTRYRLRHQVRPHYSTVLLVAAAAATRAAAHLTGDEEAVALATAGAAFTTAVVAAFVAGKRLKGRRVRAWATACAFAAASWLTWVANVGLSFDAVTLLALLVAALAVPYVDRHRIPNVPPDEEVAASLGGYAQLWATYLGGTSGGPLAGSWLTGHELIASGERFVLQLVPGKQTLGHALSALPLLRTGLFLNPRQDLIIERHPLFNESCLQLTIVTKSTVLKAKKVPWPGPNYDPHTGTIALGPFIDGDGTGRWRLYTGHRMWGGFLLGSTGSGKSRMLDSIALSAVATGITCVWYADPQKGASSPMLAKHADYVARDIEQIRQMFALAMLVKELRQAENALDEVEGFVPSEDRPGLLIIVDECHRAFADAAIQEMATELAREGNKLGIAILAASQSVTVDTFGTGNRAKDGDTLRGSLIAGNLVVMWTKSGNAKQVLKIDVDPTLFPRVHGYAYLVDETGVGRSAPLRGYYLDDVDRDRCASRVHWRGLDEGAANACGSRYLNRRDLASADREALAARVAAMRAGRYVPPPTPQPAAATTTMTATPTTAWSGPSPAQAARPVAIPTTVIQFPTWPPASTVAGPVATGDDDTPQILRSERGQRIYQLIQSGVERTGALVKQSGYSETWVRNTCRELVRVGRVRDAGHGRWVLPDSTGADAGDEEVEQLA
ncbi:hypothetical protein [Micromonospora sp. NPDC049662]|uniref:hypothetical protein n=1 Tax=Micromonospora sp. NPDC049662 TaxID=3155397 RepID=UPI003416C380